MWIVLLLLAACTETSLAPTDAGREVADPPVTHDLPHSGSRLRIVWSTYEDGTRQWDPRTLYDSDRGELCTPTTLDVGSFCLLPDAVDLGDNAPLDRVVAAGPRLSTRGFTSGDGLWLPQIAHDTLLDADCWPTPEGRCRPNAGTGSNADVFVDAQCTQRIALRYGASARFATTATGEYYLLGSVLSPGQIYSLVGGTCEPEVTPPAPAQVTALGARVALARASRVRTYSGARFDRFEVARGGVGLDDDYLYDRTLDAVCTRATTSDGATRCVPYLAPVETLATSCDPNAALVEVVTTQEPEPLRFARRTSATGAVEIHAVGHPHVGNVYWVGHGHCDQEVDAAVYDVGHRLPLTTFASATTSIGE
jgi:hypothetical protein